MPAEAVVDASVMGAAFFNEDGSAAARTWLTERRRLIAPALIRIELASLAAKKVWRAEASAQVGRRAFDSLGDFIGEFAPAEDLVLRAFDLAAQYRFSAYDSLYLALAESRSLPLVTMDQRLIARVGEAGLGCVVQGLR